MMFKKAIRSKSERAVGRRDDMKLVTTTAKDKGAKRKKAVEKRRI